jgi:NADH dehydrogenase
VILVTGATGFVGAEILRRASRRGWRVRGLARNPERAEALGRLPHVELYRADVRDRPELEEAMADVESVIHLVGIIAPTRHLSFEQAHVGGTESVLEACKSAGIRRYVHMSALGAERGRERSEYWRTKWRAEEAVRASGLDATIMRPSLIFGPDDQFFNRLARVARWSPIVPLPSGGRQEFQPVWVGDVAEVFLQAARMEATPRPIYHVAGPEILKLREIVGVLAGILGKRRAVLPVPITPLLLAAAIAEQLPSPPVTRDQLAMLTGPNVADPESVRALTRDFEIEHASLAQKAPDWLARKVKAE